MQPLNYSLEASQGNFTLSSNSEQQIVTMHIVYLFIMTKRVINWRNNIKAMIGLWPAKVSTTAVTSSHKEEEWGSGCWSDAVTSDQILAATEAARGAHRS